MSHPPDPPSPLTLAVALGPPPRPPRPQPLWLDHHLLGPECPPPRISRRPRIRRSMPSMRPPPLISLPLPPSPALLAPSTPYALSPGLLPEQPALEHSQAGSSNETRPRCSSVRSTTYPPLHPRLATSILELEDALRTDFSLGTSISLGTGITPGSIDLDTFLGPEVVFEIENDAGFQPPPPCLHCHFARLGCTPAREGQACSRCTEKGLLCSWDMQAAWRPAEEILPNPHPSSLPCNVTSSYVESDEEQNPASFGVEKRSGCGRCVVQ
ncbi:hypothetical protein OH76DRAFT_1490713 [Lentinus brumalis]|uniref:Zn(2)-C6 fungal-type domain-containing protein n=1 Tax=Lentinus brumalis TaxID=2498619 RepID=A0A371CI26_9APHY|nr:hypothetical protein OH76DRAFT_1490713 [Polyporus brumalis]